MNDFTMKFVTIGLRSLLDLEKNAQAKIPKGPPAAKLRSVSTIK